MSEPSLELPEGFADPEGAAGPVTLRQAVAWGELDAFRHVNHTVYLRWFENVRILWFERVGITALMREQEGRVGPIMARLSCDYRSPVDYPDTILANNRCTRVGRSSLTLANQIWSLAQGKIVAEAEIVIVLVDSTTGKGTPLPEAVVAAIQALDGVGF